MIEAAVLLGVIWLQVVYVLYVPLFEQENETKDGGNLCIAVGVDNTDWFKKACV